MPLPEKFLTSRSYTGTQNQMEINISGFRFVHKYLGLPAVLQQEKFHFCFPFEDISRRNLLFYVEILEKILVKSQDWIQKSKLLFEIFEKI